MYTYDTASNLLTRTDSTGAVTSYTPDAGGLASYKGPHHRKD
jgi:hypothetical protein